MPGHPDGKAEKSLCSLGLPGTESAPSMRLASMSWNWTPRSSAFFSPLSASRVARDGKDLQLYDSAPDSDGDGLSAIARPELLHDVLDMSLHRLFGDKEERCYVAV